ncbi:glycosyltransferase [Candidatus Pandoraea novymonadis]|uniref:Glycosyltransferase EpsF n=1 Tax=Candidatus Pandoraea novymonadis TaxID=1808959 RepID=A0ABX5FF55_9BURK|nr:glycosyltransferase [Candidatus Pandoraea novymonadis]PSB92346.1 putative glycosyltransferase EpsF [Candidatus Pandoraea novymonadis]
MKILFFLTGLQLGGAETQVVTLAKAILNRGHDVTLVSLTGDCVICLPKHPGFRCIELRAKKSPISLFSAILQLAMYVHKIRPHVVHSHMVHANLIARLTRLLAPIPALVCSAHSRNEGGRLRMLAYRWTDRLASITTNVSKDAVAAFIAQGAVPAHRIINIPNCIDTTLFRADKSIRQRVRATLGIGDEMAMVLAVGRLVPAKDYSTMLRAFARTLQSLPSAHLYIAGEGPMRDSIAKEISDQNLQNTITLLGRRDDIPALLSAADAFLMSSVWEGLPLVICEAMATGLPIVSTDCGGVGELLGNDMGNIAPGLSEVGDDKGLAQALILALSLTPEKRSRIAAAQRARIVAHYSLDNIVECWLTCYARIIHPKSIL